ncbi:NAD(P)H-dependent oxidoreductase [Cellulomonas cellasea]|uniref:NADPH-dependent FMN reductase n=1 Tax=Cellulomonas cellasea TaxID=43670 RepID=UPI0025A4530B|nr:NAD(P)H-dependent oxidoreductase [Cellulomonas cellasea]MDM8083461.1 NAD(P)H-dependent oxidoreductase [Cellulomonas cellasea]
MTTSAVTPSVPPSVSAPDPSRGVLPVVGNPRPGSRTRLAAEALAQAIADRLGSPLAPTIDLADLAPEVFAPVRPGVDDALRRLSSAQVAVIATPVYKASYTGLLKSFLDLYGSDGLRGLVAVPLVVSGNPAHALAGEVHLRPLLVELGASVPTRALALTESQLGALDSVVGAWLDQHGDVLAAGVRA